MKAALLLQGEADAARFFRTNLAETNGGGGDQDTLAVGVGQVENGALIEGCCET